MFKIIVAYDEDLAIGYKGWMPWDLPEDLKHFRETTEGSNLLMGSTTFNGLKKPLKNRDHYVVSSEKVEKQANVFWVEDLEAFIDKHKNSKKEIFVCGGASIYKQLLPYSKEMIISKVKGKHKADTYFVEFDKKNFKQELLKSHKDFDVYKYTRRGEFSCE